MLLAAAAPGVRRSGGREAGPAAGQRGLAEASLAGEQRQPRPALVHRSTRALQRESRFSSLHERYENHWRLGELNEAGLRAFIDFDVVFVDIDENLCLNAAQFSFI